MGRIMSDDELKLYFGNKAFEAKRRRVCLDIDAFVLHEAKTYRIVQVLDFESVLGADVETGRHAQLRIQELRPATEPHDQNLPVTHDLESIGDEDWKIAQTRLAAIRPFIGKCLIGRSDLEARAKEQGISLATLYRWIQRYNAYDTITALIPKKRGWKTGNSRLSLYTDKMIEQTINEYYLTPQRPTVKKTVIEIQRRCAELGIKAPNHMSIRARIIKISEKERLRARGFREKAKNKYYPVPGSFPNATYPLSVIQIDHTPADIILVDDIFRKPIGRPWITLAIDVYSRMIVGYYLSFDPPSETSVGMCIAHAMLPKEEWLLLHKVDALWPVWGVPITIHVDNGADFRSNNFQQSCLAYNINLEFRPVKQPRYGGHIERMLGTLLREIHALPGSTFSSIKDREGYDAEKLAALTKSEFETWLVSLICKVYHQRIHSSIAMTPLKKWEIGIFGNAEVQGVGVPSLPSDRLTVLLDFLPSFRRTAQTFGVTIDGITYYSEALRPWINLTNPETNKKWELIFRRDPRDISSVCFFDPTLKQYFKIPFADQSLPSMSIWEYQQAKEKLKREGTANVNEAALLQAITDLRDQIEEAKERSKRARRQSQRRIEHEKKASPAIPLPTNQPTPAPSMNTDLTDGDINTFGDIA